MSRKMVFIDATTLSNDQSRSVFQKLVPDKVQQLNRFLTTTTVAIFNTGQMSRSAGTVREAMRLIGCRHTLFDNEISDRVWFAGVGYKNLTWIETIEKKISEYARKVDYAIVLSDATGQLPNDRTVMVPWKQGLTNEDITKVFDLLSTPI